MNELNKINAKISRQQIGRIVCGIGSMIFGTVLIGKFMYQKGITDCQKYLRDTFSDEYDAITAKVVEFFENT